MQINKKKAFNNAILANSVLIPKLLKNPFASYSFINLDFLQPETTHFDDKVNLPFLVFIILYLYFSYVFFFFCTLNNMLPCLFYNTTDLFFY